MLKTDLHTHTCEDVLDYKINYTAKELIDIAYEKDFNILSITNHYKVYEDASLKEYAESKGILLIPGVELTIKGSHIILINIASCEAKGVKSFEDIRYLKENNNCLVICPHPFFPTRFSLKGDAEKHIDLFDAIEITGLYFSKLNFNKRAEFLAEKYNLPLLGCSDSHFLEMFGLTYTFIDANKSIESLITAVRNRKIRVVTDPMRMTSHNLKIVLSFFLSEFSSYGKDFFR